MLDPFRYVNQISWISKFQMSLTTKKNHNKLFKNLWKKGIKWSIKTFNLWYFLWGNLDYHVCIEKSNWDFYNENGTVANDTYSFQNPVLTETCSAKGCLCLKRVHGQLILQFSMSMDCIENTSKKEIKFVQTAINYIYLKLAYNSLTQCTRGGLIGQTMALDCYLCAAALL